jgi:hypothetical protein
MSDLFSYNNQKNFKLVLDPEWYNLLRYEIESEYFNQILDFLIEEEQSIHLLLKFSMH